MRCAGEARNRRVSVEPCRCSWQSRFDVYLISLKVRAEESEAHLLLALDTAEKLVSDNPDVVANRELLVDILGRRQRLQLLVFRDYAGCRASSERALVIAENLVQTYPEMMRHQRRLASVFSDLAKVYELERDFAQAELALKRSIGILQKLAAEHPRDFEIHKSLGSEYRQLADVFLVRGDFQAAMERLGHAIATYRSLASRDPVDRSLSRSWLWESLATRARR